MNIISHVSSIAYRLCVCVCMCMYVCGFKLRQQSLRYDDDDIFFPFHRASSFTWNGLNSMIECFCVISEMRIFHSLRRKVNKYFIFWNYLRLMISLNGSTATIIPDRTTKTVDIFNACSLKPEIVEFFTSTLIRITNHKKTILCSVFFV